MFPVLLTSWEEEGRAVLEMAREEEDGWRGDIYPRWQKTTFLIILLYLVRRGRTLQIVPNFHLRFTNWWRYFIILLTVPFCTIWTMNDWQVQKAWILPVFYLYFLLLIDKIVLRHLVIFSFHGSEHKLLFCSG